MRDRTSARRTPGAALLIGETVHSSHRGDPDPELAELWCIALGGLIAYPQLARRVRQLDGVHPTEKRTALLMGAIRELVAEGTLPSAAAVVERLGRSGDLDVVGVDYLHRCVSEFRDARARHLARLRHCA